MTRSEVRRRLALVWWHQLALTLAPLLVLNLLFGAGKTVSVLAMPLFIAGLASMFVSLPLFSAYKRALIATEKALDTPAEPDAWQELANRRRLAFLGAGLPAWIAALAVFAGLEAIPLILLALSSLVLSYLYRIPRQLG
ncbi:MFS transporter [Pseudomonas cavernicola]|uniref:MFS transporter n=1 Tax=Pseudomonas cavernicola TaxID=2320866 RepID=A0A418XI53_9PSED|nr:MFS transporter [Pseudomonas cavernicola]RJG12158.1 MFS transporter [Pseudomonas cavernicola]